MQNNQQHTNMEKLNLTVFPSILTALQELLTASLKKKKKQLSENAEEATPRRFQGTNISLCHKLSGMLLNRSKQNGFYLFFPFKAQLNIKFGYQLLVLLIHMSMDTNTSLETGLFFVWTAQKCVFSENPQLSA